MNTSCLISKPKRILRDIHGTLLLDKPSGITSNAALQKVKRICLAKKAGHTGSLDPLATGLLPICFGEATKFSRFLLEADKCYIVKAKLGVRTDSGDAEGSVISQKEVPSFSEAKIETVLQQFLGEIQQIPSMYSAIKYQGQPLYKLARAGKEVERTPRIISIYALELLEFKENILSLTVSCSKGTYIRTLIDDLGLSLGCGAHVVALRRTVVGPYTLDSACTLEMLEKEMTQNSCQELLLPMDSALMDWPIVKMTAATAFYVRRGQSVIVPGSPTHGLVRLYSDTGFFGVGEIEADGNIAPRRLLQEEK